jgi:uncharacterized membrane protein YphA (DoxX/SURF4 family)
VSFVDDSRTQTVPRAILAALRVYLGVVFLVAALHKVGVDVSPGIAGLLTSLRAQTYGLYCGFLDAVVLPHVSTFALLVTYGELFAAVSLLAGAATRAGAVVAGFLLVNYALAKGARPWTPASNDVAMLCIAIAVFVGRAGRAFGLDYYLARRWPGLPLW